MKSTNRYLVIIFSLIAIFSFYNGNSQNITQGEPSMEVREMAKKASNMWSTELGLTEKQEILMEKKFIEFGIKKEELNSSKMQEEAKASRLLMLQKAEDADMRNILTGIQYEKYLNLQDKFLNEQLEKNNKK